MTNPKPENIDDSEVPTGSASTRARTLASRTVAYQQPGALNMILFDEICERISQGEPLSQICRDDHMPTPRAIYRVIAIDDAKADDSPTKQRLGDMYRYARILGFHAIADEALEIADDGTNDWMRREGKNGNWEVVADKEHIARSKLRVHTRLQLLASWAPSIYGRGGNQAENQDMIQALLPQMESTSEEVLNMTPEEAYKKMIGKD